MSQTPTMDAVKALRAALTGDVSVHQWRSIKRLSLKATLGIDVNGQLIERLNVLGNECQLSQLVGGDCKPIQEQMLALVDNIEVAQSIRFNVQN